MTPIAGDHAHRCREGHTWHHTLAPGRACSLREYEDPRRGRYVSPEDCPRCSERGDLIERGRHEHRCPHCGSAWAHEESCAEAPDAPCPWCFPRDQRPSGGMRLGPHRHDCPRCFKPWTHVVPCTEPLRVALPECPTCGGAPHAGADVREVARPPLITPVRPPRKPARAPTSPGRRRTVLATLGALGVLGLMIGVFWWVWPSGETTAPPAPRAVTPAVTAPTDTPGPPGLAAQKARAVPAAPAEPAATPAPQESPGPTAPPLPAAAPQLPAPASVVTRAPTPPASGAERPPTAVGSSPIAPSVAVTDAIWEVARPVVPCVKPADPAPVMSIATGQVLGQWFDVEVDRSGPEPRCLLVLQRPDDVRWAIAARRVRTAAPGGDR